MKRLGALLFALASIPARAQTVHGSTQTILNLFPEPRERELRMVAPFISWLTLNAEKLGDGDVSVHLSGWGGMDLGNASFDGRGAGELSLAHLAWRDARRGVSLTLGRQYLLLGLARAEHFDGLHLAKRLPAGFGVEIFGGAHAGPRLTYQSGDWMVGGRLTYAYHHLVKAGISFLQARERETLQRELVGADVVVRPKDWLEIGAGALWDTIGEHLAQLDLFATSYPTTGVRVALDWRRVVPVALLDKTSIFSVFSNAVRNEAGGDVSWRFGRRVTLGADAHALAFDDGEGGYRAGVSASLALGPRLENTLTLRVGRWRGVGEGYTELRAATRHAFTEKFFGVLDVQAYLHDVATRGERLSFGCTAAVGYEPVRRLRALLAVEAGVTPLFERVAQLVAKLEYAFLRAF